MLIAELRREVAGLKAVVAPLLAENAELKARLGRNSSNSSKPPSGDPPSAPPRRSREPTGRPRGGQPGHKKHERMLLPPERVTAVQELKPAACRRCGGALSGIGEEPHRHQVIDVPQVLAMALEYRPHSLRRDRCCITTQAGLPEGVPVTMVGPRLQAMVAVMSGAVGKGRRLPVEEGRRNVPRDPRSAASPVDLPLAPLRRSGEQS